MLQNLKRPTGAVDLENHIRIDVILGVGFADAALRELPPYVPPFGRTFAHGRHKKTQPLGLGFVWLPLADLNCGPSD